MNKKAKFSLEGGVAGLVLLVALALICSSIPDPAFSHGEKKHAHDLEKLPAKPEGMIEFGKEATPGTEYLQDPPVEGMDHSQHDMGLMDHDMKSDAFQKRGAHDMGNLQKPKTSGTSGMHCA